MPTYSRTVKIPGKTAQELYDRVSQEIDKFLDRISMGKYDLHRDPAKREVRFKASMAAARLSFEDEIIHLDAQLGLLAMPFRGKLDAGIDKWLARTFNLPIGQG